MTRSVKFAAPNLLQARLQRWRSRFILGIVAFCFLALAGRAVWLQTIQGDFLLSQGAKRYEREIELPANRGNILDRHGAVLATSLPARAIWAFSDKVDLADPRILDLARLLGLKPAELQAKLEEGEGDFVYLRHQVDLDVAERIKALQISGIGMDREYKRHYPEGESIAHLVGFTSRSHVGQEGLELSFEKTLGGLAGKRRVVRDGSGQIIAGLDTMQEPRDGRDLQLTIDTRIQFQAYSVLKAAVREHQAKAGAAVVIDTRTGDVLALTNYPSYDPNDLSRRVGAKVRNRAITDAFEPGSTIKPFTAAMALESGRFKPQSMFDVHEGKLKIGRDTIHDAHRIKEPISLEQVVQKSSNVGTAKLALELPAEKLAAVLSHVGFGSSPRIGFPGATGGVLRPAAKWKPIEHATISYGHGLSASLLQLARAYTVFSGNGELLPINLYHRPTEDRARAIRISTRAAGSPVDPSFGADTIRGERVIRPETARAVRHMLELAVNDKGTAPQARIPGYRVGGKTGTARKIENGRYVKKYVASFVGLAPMSDPRIVVAVMIDEPGTKRQYGGEVAGPLFAAIAGDALHLMHVEPDAPFETRIIPAASIKEGT